jgi:hypothetical protein
MPRILITYRLDKRVTEALEVIAAKHGTNANHYLEMLLFSHAQAEDAIDIQANPLGETRGGRRKGSGRKATGKKLEKSDPAKESDAK